MSVPPSFDDWRPAPNIAGDPVTYELENAALQRDGRLDAALHVIAPWDGRVLLDIGCGSGFWLPPYAERAEQVIGVEPDRELLDLAARRVGSAGNVDVCFPDEVVLDFMGGHQGNTLTYRLAVYEWRPLRP